MKRENFVRVDGFEDVIKRLKSGSCRGVECNDCPFSYSNATNRRDCEDNGYNHSGDVDISAIEFENLFIIRTPSLESIRSKLTEAEVDYIKNNPEAFNNKGFEGLNGIGRIVDSGKFHSTYENFIKKYNIENWECGRQLPNNFPTIDFKVIGCAELEQGNDLIYVIEHDNKTWLIGEEGLEWKELVQIKVSNTTFDQETNLYKAYFKLDWSAANFVYTDRKTHITHNIIVNPERFNIVDFNKELRQFGFEVVM